MKFAGADNRATIVLYGYCPCYNAKSGSRISYQQQRRYLIGKEDDLTCPRRRFQEDLFKQLEIWKEEGNEIIVCMDANENIYDKCIGKTLMCPTGLDMKEVVGNQTGKKIEPTYTSEARNQ